MAPKLGDTDLFKHMKKKKNSGGSGRGGASNTAEGSSSATVSEIPLIRKRPRAAVVDTGVSSVPSPSVNLDQGVPGFHNSASKSSLWSVDFPFAEHVDKYLSDSEDLSMIKDVGIANLCRMFEVQSLRSASIARFMEKEYSRSESDFAEQRAVFENEKKNLLGEISKCKDRIKTLESDLEIAATNLENLNKDKEFNEKEAQLEIDQLRGEALDQHILGFEKALAQVKLLYPDLNLENCGVLKVIQGGELVDMPDDDDQADDQDIGDGGGAADRATDKVNDQ